MEGNAHACWLPHRLKCDNVYMGQHDVFTQAVGYTICMLSFAASLTKPVSHKIKEGLKQMMYRMAVLLLLGEFDRRLKQRCDETT